MGLNDDFARIDAETTRLNIEAGVQRKLEDQRREDDRRRAEEDDRRRERR
jgi:hypothetical protein